MTAFYFSFTFTKTNIVDLNLIGSATQAGQV